MYVHLFYSFFFLLLSYTLLDNFIIFLGFSFVVVVCTTSASLYIHTHTHTQQMNRTRNRDFNHRRHTNKYNTNGLVFVFLCVMRSFFSHSMDKKNNRRTNRSCTYICQAHVQATSTSNPPLNYRRLFSAMIRRFVLISIVSLDFQHRNR
jgi:hypothetical protein